MENAHIAYICVLRYVKLHPDKNNTGLEEAGETKYNLTRAAQLLYLVVYCSCGKSHVKCFEDYWTVRSFNPMLGVL